MGVLVLETELVRGQERDRSVGDGEQQRQQRRVGRDEIESDPLGQDGGEQAMRRGERLPAHEQDEGQGQDRDRDRRGEAPPGRAREPVGVGGGGGRSGGRRGG